MADPAAGGHGAGPAAEEGGGAVVDGVDAEATRALEALLLVAEEPLDPRALAQLLELPPARVERLLGELAVAYDADRRGFALVRVAGGWRLQTRPDLAPYVERFAMEGQSSRLSMAALETLAIVAYKQPISRAQVSTIRGVSVDGVLRTLQQRGYVHEVARDPGPGQAVLFGTTRTFLEELGLDSLDDLPPLDAFVPGPDVVEALEHGLRSEVPEGGDGGDRADGGGRRGGHRHDDGGPGPAPGARGG